MLWMKGKFWRAYKIRMGSMTEGDEFEPDELQGGLIFSEDEEDLVGHEEKDDW